MRAFFIGAGLQSTGQPKTPSWKPANRRGKTPFFGVFLGIFVYFLTVFWCFCWFFDRFWRFFGPFKTEKKALKSA
jgi:hypothetical protein